MRNVIIFTMGTRGDIQPYIFLAQALNEDGWCTSIGTHPCWKGLVEDAGVEFIPVGPRIDIEYEAAVIRGKTKNPMLSMLKTMNFVFKIIEKSSGDIYNACAGKNLVIVSHSQMGSVEAEALHIQTVNVTLQTQMIPEKNKKQTTGSKLFGLIVNPLTVKPYNKIRKLYQLSPVKTMDSMMSEKLNLIPVSRYFVKQSPYWEAQNKVVGYWFKQDDKYEPEEELKSFIQSGDKPIILALGAMSFESVREKEKLDMFVRAFQRTGMRAVIQGFNRTLEEYHLPESMISVGSVPHSWLFQQGYCVIHHCGFGTAASAMLYGIPSIPVPHVLDQFAFAERLYQLNAGTSPVKAGSLSEERIVQAIEELRTHYCEIQKTVEELARKMRDENGLDNAVKLIRDIYE